MAPKMPSIVLCGLRVSAAQAWRESRCWLAWSNGALSKATGPNAAYDAAVAARAKNDRREKDAWGVLGGQRDVGMVAS